MPSKEISPYKACSKCKTRLPAIYENFGPRKEAALGFDSQCRDCRAISRKKWKDANGKTYYTQNKGKWSAYYQKNKRRILTKAADRYAADPKSKKIAATEWATKNPGKRAAYIKKTKTRRAQRAPQWLSKDHCAAMRRIYTKAAELTQKTGVRYHVDHIIPLNGKSVSGLHVPWNLQILTAEENMRKNNKF